MKNSRRNALAVLASLATSLFLHQTSHAADNYPSKPLRLIAPSSPGGILDITSRVIGKKLSEQLKQPVVVENVPGAAGILGMQSMLRAEPDGYTLVMGSSGPNAVNYTLYSKLPYKMSDFAPVISIITMPNALVINANTPVKTLAEFSSYARNKPGGLSMAISMIGTSGHLGGELVRNRLDFPAVTVPYKGAAPAAKDLVGGEVDFMVENVITVAPLVKGGKLRALGVTTKDRSPILPDVPTLAEQGYPDIDVGAWLGVLVSANTPPAIVERLNAELNKVLADEEVKKTLAQQGGKTLGGTPAEFDAFIRSEKDRWEKVIRVANIRVE
ncbi:Bug family tripartite tricarboxylate transporter substrate binding protein [Noviherbaspirillum sp. Root189]|uniref:Bug family tripartite tricarboxylate transporter substrate binding protein n=1 Tax=Noviherbaspirillum sp. Root189 TaxID=1736487 RepID=UPI0007101440|nr:tripartite tricarboxylate transporter substrate binding protein [Noviherbaspirillum sp. Root189]KRB93487.1 ABC transporter substrate-binding protein [Noviherbaspirillum sp. Root189]